MATYEDLLAKYQSPKYSLDSLGQDDGQNEDSYESLLAKYQKPSPVALQRPPKLESLADLGRSAWEGAKFATEEVLGLPGRVTGKVVEGYQRLGALAGGGLGIAGQEQMPSETPEARKAQFNLAGYPEAAYAAAVAEPMANIIGAAPLYELGFGALGKVPRYGPQLAGVAGAAMLPGMLAGGYEHGKETFKAGEEKGFLSPEAIQAGIGTGADVVFGGMGLAHAAGGLAHALGGRGVPKTLDEIPAREPLTREAWLARRQPVAEEAPVPLPPVPIAPETWTGEAPAVPENLIPPEQVRLDLMRAQGVPEIAPDIAPEQPQEAPALSKAEEARIKAAQRRATALDEQDMLLAAKEEARIKAAQASAGKLDEQDMLRVAKQAEEEAAPFRAALAKVAEIEDADARTAARRAIEEEIAKRAKRNQRKQDEAEAASLEEVLTQRGLRNTVPNVPPVILPEGWTVEEVKRRGRKSEFVVADHEDTVRAVTGSREEGEAFARKAAGRESDFRSPMADEAAGVEAPPLKPEGYGRGAKIELPPREEMTETSEAPPPIRKVERLRPYRTEAEIPRDAEGNRILPGEEGWEPGDRAAVDGEANRLVRDIREAERLQRDEDDAIRERAIESSGTGKTNFESVEYEARGSGGKIDPRVERAIERAKKGVGAAAEYREGHPLGDLPYSPRQMAKALADDRGNAVELAIRERTRDVIEGEAAERKAIQSEDEGAGDVSFDPGKFAIRPAPGQRGIPGVKEDVGVPEKAFERWLRERGKVTMKVPEGERASGPTITVNGTRYLIRTQQTPAALRANYSQYVEKYGEFGARRGSEQKSMFGGEMLQGVESRTTEGRETDGPLFKQEEARRAKEDAGRQTSLPGRVADAPEQPTSAEADLKRARQLHDLAARSRDPVRHARAAAKLEERALANGDPAGRPMAWDRGKRVAYTGKTQEFAGKTFHEVEVLEGSDIGKTRLSGEPPPGPKLAGVEKGAVEGAVRKIVSTAAERLGVKGEEFGGLLPGDAPQTGQRRGSNEEGRIFLNKMRALQDAADTGVKSLELSKAANDLVDAVEHELAHRKVSGHGTDFTEELSRVQKTLGTDRGRFVRDLLGALREEAEPAGESVRAYEIRGVSPEEYAKADRDLNYSPKERVIGMARGRNEVEVSRDLERQKKAGLDESAQLGDEIKLSKVSPETAARSAESGFKVDESSIDRGEKAAIGKKTAAKPLDLQQVKTAIPGFDFRPDPNGGFVANLSEGRTLRVTEVGEIELGKAGAALEASAKAAGVEGEVEPVGVYRRVGKDGLIAVAKGAPEGTDFHEGYHAVRDLALNERERAAASKKYGDEETEAYAYAKWAKDRIAPNSWFSKIMATARRLVHHFRPTWESTFEEVASGRAAERVRAGAEEGRSVMEEGQSRFAVAPANGGVGPVKPNVVHDEITRYENWIDRWNLFKKMGERVGASIKSFAENPYLQLRTFRSRQSDLQRYVEDKVAPEIGRRLKDAKISLYDAWKYFYAKHAIEANPAYEKRFVPEGWEVTERTQRDANGTAIRSRDANGKVIPGPGPKEWVVKDAKGNEVGAAPTLEAGNQLARQKWGKTIPHSGMSTAEAQRVIAKEQRAGRTKVLDEAQAEVNKLNDKVLAFGIEKGLWTKDQSDQWKQTWGDNWLSLRHNVDIDGTPMPGPMNMDIPGLRGPEVRMRSGAYTEAFNPLVATLDRAVRVFRRGERNSVWQSFATLREKSPALKDTYDVVDKVPPNTDVDRSGERIGEYVGFKENGKQKYLRFKNPAHVETLLSLNPSQADVIGKGIQRFTRLNAALNTRWSPAFAFFGNPIVDVGEALFNTKVEHGTDVAMGMIGRLKSSRRAAAMAIKGLKPTNAAERQLLKDFEEYQKLGGPMGNFSSLDILTREDAMRHAVEGQKPIPATFKVLKDAIGKTGETLEAMTRFALYQELVSRGKSKAEAIMAARDVTVDFERAGLLGHDIGRYYAFFNAGIQGTNKMVRVIRENPAKAAQVMGGLVTLGMAQDQMMRAWYGDDDKDGTNDWDQVPQHVKENNLMFGKQKFPLPRGWRIFNAFGVNLSQMMSGVVSPQTAAFNSVLALNSLLNPLGEGLGGKSLKKGLAVLATPTAAKPLMEIALNQTALGGPVRPEQPKFGPPKPESELAFKTVNPIADAFAKALNRVTGGDKITPGGMSLSPEDIEQVITGYSGGLGKTVSQVAGMGVSALKGETPSVRQVPVASRFIYSESPTQQATQFYTNRDEVKEAVGKQKLYIENYRKDRSPKTLAQITELRKIAGAKGSFDAAERELKRLHEAKRAVEARKGDTKQIDLSIEAAYKKANRAVAEQRKRAGLPTLSATR